MTGDESDRDEKRLTAGGLFLAQEAEQVGAAGHHDLATTLRQLVERTPMPRDEAAVFYANSCP